MSNVLYRTAFFTERNFKMKNRFIRAAAFAAAACLSMSSCSEKSNKKDTNNIKAETISANSDNMNAAELLAGSYKLKKYKEIPEISNLRDLVPLKNGGFIAVSWIYGTRQSCIYTLNDDLSEVNAVNITIPDDAAKADGYDSVFSISHSGNIAALYTMYDNGGITPPDDDENFDYREFYENQKNSYGLCFYNSDGTIKSYANLGDLGDIKSSDGERLYSCSFVQAGESSALVSFSNGIILLCGIDGKTEKLPLYNETESFYTADFTLDTNDNIYMTYSYYEGDDIYKDTRCIVPVDTEKKAYGDVLMTIGYTDPDIYDYYIMSGYGDYPLLISDSTDLYGIKSDGTKEKILNWADSDTGPMGIVSIGNDEYYCWGKNMYDSQIYKLVPRQEGDGENTQVLTLGLMYGGNQPMVNSFNRSQDKYRIKVINYSEMYRQQNASTYNEPQTNEEYDEVESGIRNLMQMDVISGNAPDILLCYDHNDIQTLSSKGLFTDLYTIMENDPDINRETMLPNLLKAMESGDGHLYSITPSFSLCTLAVKSKFSDRENWTLQDMIDLYDKSNAEHRYDNNTKTRMLEMLLEGQSDFIDLEHGKCNFDSPEFVELLKFCNRFVEKIEPPCAEDDYDAMDAFFMDQYTWFAKDKDLVRQCAGYDTFLKYDTFGGDDYTLVGYPSSNGKGGKLSPTSEFAICKTSSKQEGAWEFIKSFFDFDNEYNYCSYNYPALKTEFKKALDEKTKMYAWDENGNQIEVTTMDPDVPRSEYPLTKDDRDALERYLLSCDTLFDSISSDVKSICLEEANAYFHGERSAEEAAKLMQNRISIFVSEKN